VGLTDWELVERAKQGDRKAFHQLVDRFAPRLYQVAAVMTGNYTDAQDLVQETLLGAYEGLPAFEGRSSVKTWLTGIMIRQASLQRRRSSRDRKMTSLDQPAVPGEVTDLRRGVSSSETTRTNARLDLMSLMSRLSEEHRDVLVLRELEGLSYEEIAQMMGVPRGTIESRLFRARQALKELARLSESRNDGKSGGVS
jgi:RNA polymerase sigma-70 factor (ECF subfamily)